MKVLFLEADTGSELNTSFWRCRIPAKALSELPGWETQVVNLNDRPRVPAAAAWADMIIIERLVLGQTLVDLQLWKQAGKTVIASIDDAYDLMPIRVPSYRFWHDAEYVGPDGKGHIMRLTMRYKPVEQLVWGVKECHAVITPSQRLTEDWLRYTPYAYYLPNFLDYALYAPVTPQPHAEITIGYGSSATHQDSFLRSGLPEALGRVIRHNSNVNFVLAGGDFELFRKLPIPNARKRLVPKVPFADWPKVLASFDIGLIPLSSGYDERRSYIKAIEYLVSGIPWVGSDKCNLQEVKDLGILVHNDPKSWEQAIEELVHHIDTYRIRAYENVDMWLRVDATTQANKLANLLGQIHERASNERYL